MAILPFEIPHCQIERVILTDQGYTVHANSQNQLGTCPDCETGSRSVHSYYVRTLHDLPCGEQRITLHVTVRRFRCQVKNCQRCTFAESLPQLTVRYARRTNRLQSALRQIAHIAGGQAGAHLARCLHMVASRRSLLYLLRHTEHISLTDIRILGVDDWAKRRGQSYGTILVNLETHRIVDLLPDRRADTLASWLRQHPSIEIVTRDRSTEYASGITDGAPQAIQVADRWHLLKNLSEMTTRALSEQLPELKQTVTSVSKTDSPGRRPFPRSQHDRQRQEQSRDRRFATYQQVHYLKQKGYSQRHMARLLGISRGSVRTFYETPQFPERKSRSRPSQLDPYLDYLETRYSAAPVTASQLWKEISEQGYPGRVRQVARWLSARRQPALPQTVVSPPMNTILMPTADICHRLITSAPEQLEAEELRLLDQLLHITSLNQLYVVVQSFGMIVRQQRPDTLDDWLRTCASCPISACRRFAESLLQDYDAVKAALALPWSNGQTEGQIHRLKLLKRQMYGRAKLDLLRIRAMYKPA